MPAPRSGGRAPRERSGRGRRRRHTCTARAGPPPARAPSQLVVPLARDHGGDAEQLAARRRCPAPDRRCPPRARPRAGGPGPARSGRAAGAGSTRWSSPRPAAGQHRGLAAAGAPRGSPPGKPPSGMWTSTTTRSRSASDNGPGVPRRRGRRGARANRPAAPRGARRARRGPAVRSGPPSGDGGAGGRTSRAR